MIEHFVARALDDLFGRWDGPMWLRLIVQPMVASGLALRDGIRDARRGEAPFGWSLWADARRRTHRIREGWQSIHGVFFLALAIDAIYQLAELRWIYPGEALIVAPVVSLVPYVLLRGPVNRLTRLIDQRCKG